MSREQLWAPWRLPYIVAAKDERPKSACFICDCVEQSADEENLVVARGKRTITILNRFPYNNGHLLIAPLAHKASLTELQDEELLECTTALRHMTEVIQGVMSPDGFNIGLNLGQIAGAGVPGHLHWHLVPRWSGDTSFMPVLADVNVIPQSLHALWEILQERLRESR